MFNSSSQPDLQKHRAVNVVDSGKYVRDVVQPYINRALMANSKTTKKRQQQEINELHLMKMDLSKGLKVACYDLQQIRPLEDADMIRETAQVLEDMLQAVTGDTSGYKYTNPAAYLKKNQKRSSTAEKAERAEQQERLAAGRRQRQEEQER